MLRIRLHPNLLIVLSIIIFAAGCSPQSTPTPFRPPTQPGPTPILSTTTPIPALYTAIPTPTITATIIGPCTNDLKYLDDITIKDNTSVLPGASIDKQWLVKNSGTCNWDSTYHLKWIGGDPLGAAQEHILYPARAGTQATLHVLFTAPTSDGSYETVWQAYDSKGTAFGDQVNMKIIVSP